MGREDLDETIPLNRNVEPTDDDEWDALKNVVNCRDSTAKNSVSQQSAQAIDPLLSGSGSKALRYDGNTYGNPSSKPRDGVAGQATSLEFF